MRVYVKLPNGEIGDVDPLLGTFLGLTLYVSL